MNHTPVYFLPGTMCDERLWHKVWPLLDIEAHHLSLTKGTNFESIDRLIGEKLPDEPVHLIGFSMGGYAAMHFTLNHPDRIKSLTLIGSSAQGLQEEEIELREAYMEVLINRPYSGISNGRILQLLSPLHHDNQDIIACIKTMDRALGKDTLIQQVTATTYRPSLLNQLKRIEQPVLLVCGKQDSLVNLEIIREMRQALPNAHTKVIDNCGHMIPLEKPAELAEAIKSFLGV